MYVQILKSKIHRARLTSCVLDYEGSLEVDMDILDEAGVLPYEKLLVVNSANGERLETYAIPGARGSRVFCLNGAAARKGIPGDMITLMVFAQMEENEARHFKPKVLVLNEDNQISKRK